MLGLSSVISHSLIIWLLAAPALYFGGQWNAESVEPYPQIGSAVCILALAARMFFRTRRELREASGHHHPEMREQLLKLRENDLPFVQAESPFPRSATTHK